MSTDNPDYDRVLDHLLHEMAQPNGLGITEGITDAGRRFIRLDFPLPRDLP